MSTLRMASMALKGQTRMFSVLKYRSTKLASEHLMKPQGTIQGRHVENYHYDKDNNLVVNIKPLPRKNESVETKIRRLLYQARKRGILETDLLLSRFADRYLIKMTEAELNEYDKLWDEMAWDIYYWAKKNYKITPLPDRWKHSKVLGMLKESSNNGDKVILRMPELKKEEMTIGLGKD